MASIVERDGRWRALVRKSGVTRCATFGTRGAARAWAQTVERQADELKASGIIRFTGTLGDLIDKYTLEQGVRRPWGKSKANDLARLKRDLGQIKAAALTGRDVTAYFERRNAEGAGPVVVSGQAGYLIKVLETARNNWHFDVPLQAARDARSALANLGMVGKSKRRDRRVTDAELAAVIADIETNKDTALPVRDILQFCVASAMRISEVTRLAWTDLNETDKTVVVRDRKHPQDRLGNDQVVALLPATGYDAFEIVQRQPRRGDRIFPYNARTVGAYVTRACKRLKLKGLSLHDLRHEGISRLFEAGYQIHEVALVSGHRDWAMLKRYTHVRAADLHRRPLAAPIQRD